MKRIISKLLITPVDFDCNMACKYCYNGSFHSSCIIPSKIISMDIIFKIFSQVAPLLKDQQLFVIWHGGEPLLAGKDFYREAITVQKMAAKNRYKTINCIQTNGSLIDEEWADLFIKLKFNPSVSIDGPAYINNKVRVFINNSSTYDKIMYGYRLLQKKDINTGMLIVISKANVQEPDILWNWVLEQCIPHFDFLPCIEPELIRKGEQIYSITTEESARFLTRFFDLWFKHGDPDIRIRTFRDAIKGQIGGHVNICSWKLGCLHHVSFDTSGNAFPCARYNCYPETKLGNINEMSFTDIMESSTTKWVHNSITRGQKRCENCQWKSICGSGCPFLKYALYGTWDAPYIHCKVRQSLFMHVRRQIFK